MPDWLDSWTNTRYLNQQDLAKRWARRSDPAPEPAKPLPIEHTKYILTYGKKRYRIWVEKGCPTPPYDLRPLRADEPIPIEYDDPIKQAAFEALYKDRRWLLRVPIWVPR